ncbi:tRNA(Thr) (cytosine(32)-N(3))-methyltransferase [Lachnellula arida]|uniref:tRNA N(3)-methylcytidine methyltransferase n=1 Tax=Lachnellula arida TaxID=1316785 RepID=A0A8T9B8P7_9HELO|nr:tRNA(Thr) (cytosine(32)-N(3))-methyltransferase [Lachnellula arida]
MESSSSNGEAVLVQDLSALTVKDSPAATEPPQPVAPHRSHDPQNNLKRSDPFQFGSRYLNQEDNVFEFNAWDHVETDDTYKEYAEQQYAKQREAPVSDFDKTRFNSDPAKWWNNFYKNNTANFFKDRKWLQQEFPVLSTITQSSAGPITLLEVGAGAGNTAFPILAHNENPGLKIHACDFSKKSVEVIRANEAYDTKNIQADVWDVASNELPPGLGEESVDVVIMIFIFSALSPSQWDQAVQNIYKVLKPGGEVLFRDYGRGDLAQVRFKKGRYLEENFYIRGDGTRVYFFERDELVEAWTAGERFEVVDMGVDRRLLVNRAKQLKMYRCWLQGRFRKPNKKPT